MSNIEEAGYLVPNAVGPQAEGTTADASVIVETTNYSDGITATGPSILPEHSPAQQDRVEAGLTVLDPQVTGGVTIAAESLQVAPAVGSLQVAPAPSVGRRVWYWSGRIDDVVVLDRHQPFDAGILFVHGSGRVNLGVTDHAGNHHAVLNVALVMPGDVTPEHGGEHSVGQWMPIQTNAGYAKRGVPQ